MSGPTDCADVRRQPLRTVLAVRTDGRQFGFPASVAELKGRLS